MKSPLRSTPCRNCQREYPADELDDQRWCRSCRALILIRANRWARAAAIAATVALVIWIAIAIAPSTRFLVAWMAIVAATYIVIHRIVRRVAFEIIRSRGVSPSEE